MKNKLYLVSLIFLLASAGYATDSEESLAADKGGISAVSSSGCSPSGDQPEFSLKQSEVNQILVRTAQGVYGALNKNCTYLPAEFPDSPEGLETDDWQVGTVANGGGKMCALVLKACPKNFTKAFDSLLEANLKIECTIALQLVRIFTLKACLGDSLFEDFCFYNYCFLRESESEQESLKQFFYTIAMTAEFTEQPIQRLISLEDFRQGDYQQGGCMTYLHNHPAYSKFKPKGADGGMNAVLVGDKLTHLGFDKFYRDGPKTYEQLAREVFYDEFVSQTDLQTDLSDAHGKMVAMLEGNPRAKENFVRKIYSKNPDALSILDAEVINQTVTTILALNSRGFREQFKRKYFAEA